ncbi:MAG: hypothetical protein ACYCOO_01975 [Chitinophagaceae bacterium]
MDKFFIKLVFLFCFINGIGISFAHLLGSWGIVDSVGAIGNLLLALLTAISYYFNSQAIKSKNNHAFIRSVYLATFLKLMLCIAAVLVYVVFFRSLLDKSTIFLLMFLYFLYTFLETFSLFHVSKPKRN